MSSWPLVKYVDSPATTATVRYDFNDQAATPLKKVTEFDPGVPTLEGDPDAVGQQWGFRSPSITHTITGTKAQAMAQLSLVSREQLRRTNWLLFRPSAAQQPVWFKTYRTGYQPVTLDRVYVRTSDGGQVPLKDTWKIVVPVVAEAFAYGAQEVISTATITQAPSGTNAMRYVLPPIKGDAPTRLRVQFSTALDTFDHTSSWLLSCVSGPAVAADIVVDIGTGDSFGAITGTGAGVANAAYFGGSYRLVTIAANDLTTGSNFAQRIGGTFPVSIAARCKVLVRCEADDTAALPRTYTFKLGTDVGGGVIQYTPTKTITIGAVAAAATTAFQGWVDLGEVTFPYGVAAPLGVVGTVGSQGLILSIGTADNGVGAVRLDAFKLIPVDGPAATTTTTLLTADFAATTLNLKCVFDGDSETFWSLNASNVFTGTPPRIKGSYLIADPASAQNVLIAMATWGGIVGGTAHSTNRPTSLNATAAFDISYYPRFLYVGDGT